MESVKFDIHQAAAEAWKQKQIKIKLIEAAEKQAQKEKIEERKKKFHNFLNKVLTTEITTALNVIIESNINRPTYGTYGSFKWIARTFHIYERDNKCFRVVSPNDVDDYIEFYSSNDFLAYLGKLESKKEI